MIGKGEILHVRVTRGEMLAVRKACQLRDRSISNFVRVAVRGALLSALGEKKFLKVVNSVKGDVKSFDDRWTKADEAEYLRLVDEAKSIKE